MFYEIVRDINSGEYGVRVKNRWLWYKTREAAEQDLKMVPLKETAIKTGKD